MGCRLVAQRQVIVHSKGLTKIEDRLLRQLSSIFFLSSFASSLSKGFFNLSMSLKEKEQLLLFYIVLSIAQIKSSNTILRQYCCDNFMLKNKKCREMIIQNKSLGQSFWFVLPSQRGCMESYFLPWCSLYGWHLCC